MPARAATEAAGAKALGADAELRVCLLGTPRLAWSDGRVHPLQRRDAALLTMLVLDGPAPRSRVALQLWPDADPEGAPNNLRHASGSEWPKTTTKCPSYRKTRRASANALAKDFS